MWELLTGYQSLVKLARDAAKAIQEQTQQDPLFRIIGHHDADGISASGLIASYLNRLDCRFHITILRQLEPIFIKNLAEESHTHYIFTDLGSGQIPLLGKYFTEPDQHIFVFDHHPPQKGEIPNFQHVNPHLVGIDGSSNISGSGTAYLVGREIDSKNKDLASCAITGAIGDRQDKGEDFKLIGVNEKIVQDGIETKTVEMFKDLRFFGRETRPIYFALQYNTDPYLPGLSGNYDNCLQFLSRLEIPLKTSGGEWRTIGDLTHDEKTKFMGGIVKYYSKRKISPEAFRKLIGYVYTFPNEEKGTEMRNAHEFASLLNACGRTEHPGIGVALVYGDRGAAYQDAQRFLAEYRTQIAQALTWLEEHKDQLKIKTHLISFNAGSVINDRVISSVTSIAASSHIFDSTKVLIGLAPSENNLLKISARTNSGLVAKGIDLGGALAAATKLIKSEYGAGGHKIAAGAKIPMDTEEVFLRELNKILKKQLEST